MVGGGWVRRPSEEELQAAVGGSWVRRPWESSVLEA